MPHQLDTTRIDQIVINVLVETLNLPADEVVPEADLKEDLGLDSLDLLELLSAIEAETGTSVDDTEIRTIRTVGDAITLVERLQAAGAGQ
jgi:acyl carrier protein